MATLSDISIRRPVFAWVLMIGLMFFGAVSFNSLGISNMPDVDFPVVNIKLALSGATPEIMETNIVDIAEDSILNVEGVKQIVSESSYGNANITVELQLGRNVDAAVQEISTRIYQAQRYMPDAMEPPVISKYNPEERPIIYVAVSTESDDLKGLMLYVRDVLKTEFSVVPGIGQVVFGGWTDRNLRIWLDGKKLSNRELTVQDVQEAIRREHGEMPAGLLESAREQWSVRSMGEADSARAFGNLPILYRGGQPIYDNLIRIRDVGTVEDGLDDITRISRFNGRQAVSLGFVKQPGTNALEVGNAVKKRIAEIETRLPPGYRLDIAFDSTRFIEESVGELEFTLLLSAVLTSIVCFLFLGNFSSTLNVILAIPTSVLGTFIVLKLFGFTLNTFTLLGLTLAIGIVVDDAIMVLENIVRHREEGESLVDGARKGANEITFAATATTLSISAIFIPVVFMSGITGRYFYEFGITITAAVFISLLEALTLTPMRCSQFLSIKRNGFSVMVDEAFGRFTALYRRILAWCLDHNRIVISLSLIFFAATLSIVWFIKKEFVPGQDQSQVFVMLKTPPGSSFAHTDKLARNYEKFIADQPETLRYIAAVGGFGGTRTDLVNIFITMKDPAERPVRPGKGKRLTQDEYASVLRKGLGKIDKNVQVSVRDLSRRGFSARRGSPVELTVKGKDWDSLISFSDKIAGSMRKSGYFTDVDTDFSEGQKEIRIYPDREKAARYGVSVQSIGSVINAMIGGIKAGQFSEGGHRYDIRIRVKTDERKGVEDIQRLYLRNSRGELVQMKNVTRMEERPVLQGINRINRSRAVTISANPSGDMGEVEAVEKAEAIAREILPEGFSAEPGGSSQSTDESFNELTVALFLGIVIAYMILASQFNSFIHPFTVLMALPFSVSGALLALYIFRQSLNIYSFIALLLLLGLVKKNSILLVDFTNRMREQGLGVREALLQACPVRLRPIIMTSLATIAAAIPPAISVGPGGETRVPMAMAIIGGMLVSTLLTLFVVPSVYSVLYRLEKND